MSALRCKQTNRTEPNINSNPSLCVTVSECGDAGCVFQCPFQSGRDEVCKCPRGPRVPTGRFNGQLLKIHISLAVVTLEFSVRCVHKNVRRSLHNAAQNRKQKDLGVCEDRRRNLCCNIYVCVPSILLRSDLMGVLFGGNAAVTQAEGCQ